jgi:hypothetical protein
LIADDVAAQCNTDDELVDIFSFWYSLIYNAFIIVSYISHGEENTNPFSLVKIGCQELERKSDYISDSKDEYLPRNDAPLTLIKKVSSGGATGTSAPHRPKSCLRLRVWGG